MGKIEKQIEHHWIPMNRYNFKDMDEEIAWHEGGIEDILEILGNLNQNEDIIFPHKIEVRNLGLFLKSLRERGLDIGKGNLPYGYKMPVPIDRDNKRDLIIFRRY